jgi:pilus assembly protein Flp/PilA
MPEQRAFRWAGRRCPAATRQAVRAFLEDESGQDLVEYALIFSLIALGTIASLKGVTAGISDVFSAVSSKLGSSV